MSETTRTYHPHRPLFNRPQNPARPAPAELARDMEATQLHAQGSHVCGDCGLSRLPDPLRCFQGSMAFRGTESPRQRTRAQQRQAKALAMHLEGKTYEQIARALGYASRGNAWRAVHRSTHPQLL